ncbi:MAG TPA: SIS domain-containing protein [Kofleriaceae bacterium]|nr:SIS domain-containing protein [Kofleriaceae bacterium]
MCGVIGLVYENQRRDLGMIAAELLRTLEYRGYDSTGGAFQGEDREVRLHKGVGAPSTMVHELGIVQESGHVFCGQVRWATFGAVDDANSQPHVVRCKTFLYGAHNGNVTNCDQLKRWLRSEGHAVQSDNDGEMVVHTIEHYFQIELAALPEEARRERASRRAAMRAAILHAAGRLEGSYAAVVVDPESHLLWSIKQGSSLYFGLGRDAAGGRFAIASSDLSAVLKLTRVLVPMAEGECIEYDPTEYHAFSVCDRSVPTPHGRRSYRAGELVPREPVRSRLRAKDAALSPRFSTFMDQEIASQEATCRNVIALFRGGTEAARALAPALDARPAADIAELLGQFDRLRDQASDDELARGFRELVDAAPFRALIAGVAPEVGARTTDGQPEALAERLVSSEAGLLADLMAFGRDAADRLAIRLLDVMLEREEVREFGAAVAGFLERCMAALGEGGRILVVCCGSSYHAAKAASLFFNELAHVQLHPVLPGEFRGELSRSLRDGDLLVAVSQSGETKDLIDVMNDVIDSGRRIGRVAIVNNLNSTLAQEKAEVVIPLRCGPEIAVPATKSFVNQMAVFYCLALALAERRLAADRTMAEPERAARARELERRRQQLASLPDLIRETFEATAAAVERAAQLLYLCPSIHLLATRMTAIAMEGALKIREIVLNHAEGIEGSEFKHGPNTILGFNTVLGPAQVQALLEAVGRTAGDLASRAARQGLGPEAVQALVQAVTDSVFAPRHTPFALGPDERSLLEGAPDRARLIGALYEDYPLLYITGPDERDVALTVSQINTHKIRGAMTVIVAEEHPGLHEAASKSPADSDRYRWVYITLPRTNDNLMAAFSATVALQRLALEMSVRKASYLDQLGIQDHGVHPDVPKNVSKSITVD